MIIATFNANSLRARLGIILDWIKEHDPDVLCIQETKVTDADFPVMAFAESGHHVVYSGEKSYNGVCIISKNKPDEVSYGFDDNGPTDASRLICARYGSINVVNTYVPQGRDLEHEMYQYKLDWFARLKNYFSEHYSSRKRVVWVGDLNVAPEPMDIHNSEKQENHVCYHIDARNAFADTVSWGFEDVFRKHRPEPEQYTFYDYRTANALNRKMGWRIDHILATPPMAAKSTDSYIDTEPRKKEKPSDHTFLVAEFSV